MWELWRHRESNPDLTGLADTVSDRAPRPGAFPLSYAPNGQSVGCRESRQAGEIPARQEACLASCAAAAWLKVPGQGRRGLEPNVHRLDAVNSMRSMGKIDGDDRDNQHAENAEYVHG
jgi:hypothetical protein